ncbi:substrate-binding domain-containing protein [Actinoplanes couchii]|uniref:LacI family transcriptional regulator n=1 Tax=Actinoplanes couchii TaxID=403638 RepID=A0ABQ3XH43_9ACTN|nr:substrate-binding domain-containing protein [Actinoplanes couchii]MDR6320780.1 DNA-binding LacI/PurR family transcriptional regulator [Actinoplanes couchii]GID57735.1 LacI family transcriptional regulator [Actinoplanes couchii]
MFQVQRHERLLSELRRSGAVRVSDLARDLGVSELTIRRDIAALAARNLCHRVHGGATLPAPARPAPAARRTGFTIGMVVPSLDFYWPPIVAGARAAGAALGVNVQLRGSSYDPEEDRRQIARLVDAGQVQGLLLAPSLDGDDADRMIDWITRLPVPTILVERQPRRWTSTPRQIEWVRSDHELGMEIAVHHLYEQGHRRIGLRLSDGSPTSAYLLRGWRRACADLGIDADSGDAPTALIVHSDPEAIALAQNCADRGIRIPDDLAIVSYDDEVAHLASLTAIRPPKNHVGRLAVEMMVSRLLDGDRRPTQGVLVAPELVVRQSSLSSQRGCRVRP